MQINGNIHPPESLIFKSPHEVFMRQKEKVPSPSLWIDSKEAETDGWDSFEFIQKFASKRRAVFWLAPCGLFLFVFL